MKILPIQNQNNRPVAFGDLKSVVAGETFRDGGHYIAVALRLTGKDLEDFQDVLKFFPCIQPEKEVIHISANRYLYDEEMDDSRYNIFLNGKGFTWADNIFDMLTNPKKIPVLKKIKDKVDTLLARLYINKEFDMPKKNSNERKKMLKILAPQGQLQELEISKNKKEVGNIAGLLSVVTMHADNA